MRIDPARAIKNMYFGAASKRTRYPKTDVIKLATATTSRDFKIPTLILKVVLENSQNNIVSRIIIPTSKLQLKRDCAGDTIRFAEIRGKKNRKEKTPSNVLFIILQEIGFI